MGQSVGHGSGVPPSDNSTPAGNAGSTGGMLSIATLEKRLSDFERNSSDPNASGMAEMFRSLLK